MGPGTLLWKCPMVNGKCWRCCPGRRPCSTPEPTKVSGMYGRLVTYTHSEDRDALEAKARAGVIPIVTAIPGYVAYGVIVEDDRVISMSAWQSEEDAKSGDAALLEWVRANTTMKVQSRITGDFSWLELAGK